MAQHGSITNNHDRLSATDREVYQQSEQAARSERRGLWQAENPIAPWEFVKAASPSERIRLQVSNAISPQESESRAGLCLNSTNLTFA